MDPFPSLDPTKSIAVLFLLPNCDMSCRFCASDDDFSVMSAAQAERLLWSLHESSIRNVVLGGGEPFLWPHGLVRLSERARDLRFLVQVSTAGNSLPVGFERIVSIRRYILPLESMDPEVHDRLRCVPGGHHGRVLAALEKLAEARKELTIATVVTRENITQLAGIASFLQELQAGGAVVHAWHLYRFLAIGRAGAFAAGELEIPYEDYLNACRALQEREIGFPVYRRADMRRGRSVEYFWYEGDELKIGSQELMSEILRPHGVE